MSKDEYLLACGLYIERNPIRAGLVKKQRIISIQVLNIYAYGDSDGLLDKGLCYDNLGKNNGERQDKRNTRG